MKLKMVGEYMYKQRPKITYGALENHSSRVSDVRHYAQPSGPGLVDGFYTWEYHQLGSEYE